MFLPMYPTYDTCCSNVADIAIGSSSFTHFYWYKYIFNDIKPISILLHVYNKNSLVCLMRPWSITGQDFRTISHMINPTNWFSTTGKTKNKNECWIHWKKDERWLAATKMIVALFLFILYILLNKNKREEQISTPCM